MFDMCVRSGALIASCGLFVRQHIGTESQHRVPYPSISENMGFGCCSGTPGSSVTAVCCSGRHLVNTAEESGCGAIPANVRRKQGVFNLRKQDQLSTSRSGLRASSRTFPLNVVSGNSYIENDQSGLNLPTGCDVCSPSQKWSTTTLVIRLCCIVSKMLSVTNQTCSGEATMSHAM